MKIDNETDAFAALAALVVGADGVGTQQEREFLHGTMAGLPMFQALDANQFQKLLADTTQRVFSSLPTEDGRVTEEGISAVLRQIREMLSPELQARALEMAVGLAGSDEISAEEDALIERLRRELSISSGEA
jgi:tellurite resistance protein